MALAKPVRETQRCDGVPLTICPCPSRRAGQEGAKTLFPQRSDPGSRAYAAKVGKGHKEIFPPSAYAPVYGEPTGESYSMEATILKATRGAVSGAAGLIRTIVLGWDQHFTTGPGQSQGGGVRGWI